MPCAFHLQCVQCTGAFKGYAKRCVQVTDLPFTPRPRDPSWSCPVPSPMAMSSAMPSAMPDPGAMPMPCPGAMPSDNAHVPCQSLIRPRQVHWGGCCLPTAGAGPTPLHMSSSLPVPVSVFSFICPYVRLQICVALFSFLMFSPDGRLISIEAPRKCRHGRRCQLRNSSSRT